MNTSQWISILSDDDDFQDTDSLPIPSCLRKRKSPGGLEYIATANAISSAETADGITPSRSSSNNSKYTLVCVPDWACQAADFIPVFQSLCANNPDIHAYALNLPGHGSTPVSLALKDSSVSSSASLVQRFIDDLKLTRVVLVGHGMGVRIAVQTWFQSQQSQQSNSSPFSRHAQEAQQKQGTINAFVFLDGDHSSIRSIPPCILDDVPENKTVPGFQKLEFTVGLFESLYGKGTSQIFRATTASHIRGMDADHLVRERAQLLGYDRKDFDTALQLLGRDEKVGRCVLNLQATDYDDNGTIFKLNEGDVAVWMRHLRRRVPAARFGIVDDASHFPHTDRPEVVSEKIVAFLKTM